MEVDSVAESGEASTTTVKSTLPPNFVKFLACSIKIKLGFLLYAEL